MVYSGKAGYEWGKIETITKIELDSQSIKRIGNLISKIDQKTFKSLNEIYDDGSSWSFAKIIRFDTVKVDISNPTIDTSRRHLFEVVELVKLFANLAKLRELKENLY
jgi:predicted membrane-bound spermidine synthase